MSRGIRKKASDVFRDANYMFTTKVSFEEAFPEIEDLKVFVKEYCHGARGGINTRSYGKEVGEFVDCSNPLCYNGGFSLGKIIRNMAGRKETHKEESVMCQGYEGSPKGRRKYRKCINAFEIVVDIVYK